MDVSETASNVPFSMQRLVCLDSVATCERGTALSFSVKAPAVDFLTNF